MPDAPERQGAGNSGSDNMNGNQGQNGSGQDGMNGQQGNWQGGYQQNPYQQPYTAYDPKDHTSEFDPRDIEDNKLYASLPYFFGIVGVITALLVRESPFTRFHIKNELRLLIASVIACVPFIIPILGWIVGGVCLAILGVLKIIAIVWVLQGKAKEIPIISNIGFLK